MISLSTSVLCFLPEHASPRGCAQSGWGYRVGSWSEECPDTPEMTSPLSAATPLAAFRNATRAAVGYPGLWLDKMKVKWRHCVDLVDSSIWQQSLYIFFLTQMLRQNYVLWNVSQFRTTTSYYLAQQHKYLSLLGRSGLYPSLVPFLPPASGFSSSLFSSSSPPPPCSPSQSADGICKTSHYKINKRDDTCPC